MEKFIFETVTIDFRLDFSLSSDLMALNLIFCIAVLISKTSSVVIVVLGSLINWSDLDADSFVSSDPLIAAANICSLPQLGH